MGIEERKGEHIRAVLREDMDYSRKAGFEQIELPHNALPELDFSEVDLGINFLGKTIFPIMITAITGGFRGAIRINRELAEAAERNSFPLGLGSMRAMLEGVESESYLVRKICPSVPLVGNVGIAQLAKYGPEKIEWLVSKAELDGMAVHLNPLQEMLQPEGDRVFSDSLKLIERLCSRLSVPVVAKECGAGISREVAKKLKEAGVKWIDVSGAGGTSWSKVEYARGGSPPGFEEWGIKTVDSIMMCRGIAPLIASGGVRSGIDCAKAVALGAEIAGAARPFLIAQQEGKLDSMAARWISQMKVAAFLCGCKTHSDLKGLCSRHPGSR
ncbi:MAG: type 2 isopentenyl-diphosphate Delta-isomerase [Candidatus Bilamarchaeaceae archaeon]